MYELRFTSFINYLTFMVVLAIGSSIYPENIAAFRVMFVIIGVFLFISAVHRMVMMVFELKERGDEYARTSMEDSGKDTGS